MRTKTDQRREAIVDAAKEIIRTFGFERASVAAIAERLGGSKATIYNYFGSKEELFATAMIAAVTERAGDGAQLLDSSDPDIKGVLKRFGRAFVRLISSSDALLVLRAAAADGTGGALGPVLYAMGPCKGLNAMTTYLAQIPPDRGFQLPDPKLAALHLKSLLEGGVIEPLLYGLNVGTDCGEAVDAAIDVFVRAYGPDFSSEKFL